MTILDLVKANVASAIENGYSFADFTDEELAGDLTAYAADLEGESFEDVLAAVKAMRGEVRQ